MLDELVSLFSKGKIPAEEFAESFEKMMKKAMINSLSVRFLEKQLSELYDDMDKKADENMDAISKDPSRKDDPLFSDEDIASFRDRYYKIIDNGNKRLEAWEKVTGMDFGTDSPTSSSTRSEGIERVSEQTATELLGIWRAHYDITKQNGLTMREQVAIAHSHLVELNAININTFNTAQQALVIASNTHAMMTNTQTMIGELRGINRKLR